MGRWKPEVANRTLRARRCGSDSHSRRLGTVRWSRRLLVIKRRAPTAGGGVRDPPALLRSSARGGRDPPALIRTRGGGVVACSDAGPPPSMRTAPATIGGSYYWTRVYGVYDALRAA